MDLKSVTSALVCATAAIILSSPLSTDAQGRREPSDVMPSTLGELRAQDARVNRMLRQGGLRVREALDDKLVPGRRIERLDQYHHGVRVFGADLTRQIHSGQTVSVYGTIYDGISVDATPALDAAEARQRVEAHTGVKLGPARPGQLVILPLDAGAHALTWRYRVFTGKDIREYFVDAHSGAIVFDFSDLQTQTAVGRATGVLGDSKKISVMPGGAGFLSQDGLRPPAIRTYDMLGDTSRVDDLLNGRLFLATTDLGADSDNAWTDGAVVDAHGYAGLTYDYFYKRFDRRGLNDANIAMRSIVHPIRRDRVFTDFETYPEFFTNAFYAGAGYMFYGVGLPPNVTVGGQSWDHLAGALDIVAHELAHGVTDFTSDLIYRNESGALNEAFSDIMAAGVEFFYHPAGEGQLRADYLLGEDVIRGVRVNVNGIRSMANPIAYGDPDHYSIRYTGSLDNGGVHINSGIPNHAFYLAVEGGTNRVSGMPVQGVGGANREQIEKVFYRAFTQLLPSNANFSMARAATIQAARDLYGDGSAVERAVAQAWTAVGVN